MSLVEVDYQKCDELVELLRKNPLTADAANPIPEEIGPELSKDFYLSLIAICHQTSPLDGAYLEGTSRGKKLRGWDYLKDRLLVAVQKDPALVKPNNLTEISGADISNMMADGQGGGKITDPEGRARLLRDIGEVMLRQGWKNAEAIYQESGGYLERPNHHGLLDKLALMEAYNDPLKKKSYLFVEFMKNNGVWSYKDPKNLGSPIDYHITRGALRMGLVQVSDSALYQKLVAKEPVKLKEDLEIRGAVHEAIEDVSKKLELSGEDTHHIFWNSFRNCCPRETPHCQSCPPNCLLPDQYRFEPRCAFVPICDQKTELLEHNFQTDWY